MCADMIRTMEKADCKLKGWVGTIITRIYLACDEAYQTHIMSTEINGELNISGIIDDYEDRKFLDMEIKYSIVQDKQTEKVKRYINIFNFLHGCSHRKSESPNNFVNKFCGSMARYENCEQKITSQARCQLSHPTR